MAVIGQPGQAAAQRVRALPAGLHRVWQLLRWLPALVALLPWLLTPRVPDEAARILAASGPARFSLLDWETANLGERAPRLLAGLFGGVAPQPGDVDAARAFLQLPASERERRAADAEAALERLVAAAYWQAGVGERAGLFQGRLFPPVLVALAPPPNILVVSPRTELRVAQSLILRPGLDVAAQEALERSVESVGVASLVAPVGGIATYPAIVPPSQPARALLASIAHEWFHQYLLFYPLGAGYWASQETREINETAADLVGGEIADELAGRLDLPPAPGPGPRPAFDFRAFMRATRLEVERLLALGQVAGAEQYMEARRLELERNGYRIRKLNQAYFAFYGSYGEGFAASPRSPVPDLLGALRRNSPSLAAFVERVRDVTTVDQLRRAARGA